MGAASAANTGRHFPRGRRQARELSRQRNIHIAGPQFFTNEAPGCNVAKAGEQLQTEGALAGR
jgi:hypothetical protein